MVTRSIAWELVDAVETRVVKDPRGTDYLPAIEYRDADGRSRVAVMYWTASMRPLSAARNEAMIKALVPEGRLPSRRRLRSDDIISPGCQVALQRWSWSGVAERLLDPFLHGCTA